MGKMDLIKKIKKDIKDRKQGKISELKNYSEYGKDFNLTLRQVRYQLKKGLTREERSYVVSEIRTQTGKKSKGNPNYFLLKISKEQRQLNNKRAEEVENSFQVKKKQEGFKVVKIEPKQYNENKEFIGLSFNEEGIRGLKRGEEILKVFEELRREISNFKFPDFVSEKGDLIVFTECKSSKIDFNRHFKQRKSLNALRDRGYEIELYSVS